jgi:hypothetical protein
MSSGYIPSFGEHGPDEILAALKEATREDPGLQKRPAEELSRNLSHGGYLESEPFPPPSSRRCWRLSNVERDRPPPGAAQRVDLTLPRRPVCFSLAATRP